MKLFLTLVAIFSLWAAWIAQISCNTQDKGTPYAIVDTTKLRHDTIYIPYRNTVLIDLSRQKNLSLHEYQLELTPDSIYIYEGQRLVKAIQADSSINEVLINDNL